jgi:hypothetical protein
MPGLMLALVAAGVASIKPLGLGSAKAEDGAAELPPVPMDGTMGFVVKHFVPAVIQEAEACPEGPALKVRDEYLRALPDGERARLLDRGNEKELDQRWRASVYGPGGTNLCSQPDMFDRPMMRTVQSKRAIGLDLDRNATGAATAETCEHQTFTSPRGQAGIDNQAYRVLGCTREWRGVDGKAGDIVRGMNQFLASGEWSQVILLKGVDSLVEDNDVEVVYANTADRPMVDSKGEFLPGASFTVSDEPPRHRNVLRGRIRNGVLTTAPADIKLSQTWGQSRARDIRGHRTMWDLRRSQLRLTIRADGALSGVVGGYQPVWDLIQSPSIGGAGAALDAGIDCASELKTLKAMADGIKDPKTGQCTGVSTAMELEAVPAFVTDVPAPRTASR